MADVVQWHSRRVATCVLQKKQQAVEKKIDFERFGRNRISAEISSLARTTRSSKSSSIFFCLFLVSSGCRWNVLHSRTIVNLFDKFKSGLTFILTFVRHFVKCHAKHVNRARVLIGWQLPTHVCQPFTRQIRVYQHEKVGERVDENRAKFYLSQTVCQRVCRLFFCALNTHQLEFANTSLPTLVCRVKASECGAVLVSKCRSHFIVLISYFML